MEELVERLLRGLVAYDIGRPNGLQDLGQLLLRRYILLQRVDVFLAHVGDDGQRVVLVVGWGGRIRCRGLVGRGRGAGLALALGCLLAHVACRHAVGASVRLVPSLLVCGDVLAC